MVLQGPWGVLNRAGPRFLNSLPLPDSVQDTTHTSSNSSHIPGKSLGQQSAAVSSWLWDSGQEDVGLPEELPSQRER